MGIEARNVGRTSTGDSRGRYRWLWFRFVLITIVAVVFYIQALDLAQALLSDFPNLRMAMDSKADFWIGLLLLTLGGLLFWWRMVKVVVLMGSPIPFGMDISFGRHKEDARGRSTTLVHIGDYSRGERCFDGLFLYGAIFRAHPNSDKLVRSRLQWLMLHLTDNLVFAVVEGRFFLRKRNHSERAEFFDFQMDEFERILTSKKQDQG